VDHFTRLFAYDAWANHEVLSGLRTASEPPARCLKFIAHILAAERLWLERLELKEQTLPVWPGFTVDECGHLAADLSQRWKRRVVKLIWQTRSAIATVKAKAGGAARMTS